MKLINQLKQKMEALGGGLDEYEDFFCLDCPTGYVWRSNGNRSMSIQFANHSQTWLAQAIKGEMDNIRMGMEKVTDPKRLAELQWDLGDDNWVAPSTAPERLAWA